MTTLQVCFPTKESVSEFVKTASKLPFEMDLMNGSCVVDAKSIMGVLYLGIGRILHLETPLEHAAEAKLALADYIV